MSLNHEDLVGTVVPEISIDEYIPKAGKDEDVIVVAFYCTDEDPANDLNRFIQRGPVGILTSEVSTNTDKDGNYVVFVEMERSPSFTGQFRTLVRDIENVAGRLDWKVTTIYTGGDFLDYDDKTITNSLILDSAAYRIWKRTQNVNESVESFLKESTATYLDVQGNSVTIGGGNTRYTISGTVVDVGKYDDISHDSVMVNESFMTGSSPELKLLESMVGLDVLQVGDKTVVVNHSGDAMVLCNVYINY